MEIRYVNLNDMSFLRKYDKHISENFLEQKIKNQRYAILKEGTQYIGFLRFGFFWDEIPIMNMLIIDPIFRGKGYGRKLVEFWENEMKKEGYMKFMTSTQEDEEAQYFYRKLGYDDIGNFLLPGENAKELILFKSSNP